MNFIKKSILEVTLNKEESKTLKYLENKVLTYGSLEMLLVEYKPTGAEKILKELKKIFIEQSMLDSTGYTVEDEESMASVEVDEIHLIYTE